MICLPFACGVVEAGEMNTFNAENSNWQHASICTVIVTQNTEIYDKVFALINRNYCLVVMRISVLLNNYRVISNWTGSLLPWMLIDRVGSHLLNKTTTPHHKCWYRLRFENRCRGGSPRNAMNQTLCLGARVEIVWLVSLICLQTNHPSPVQILLFSSLSAQTDSCLSDCLCSSLPRIC